MTDDTARAEPDEVAVMAGALYETDPPESWMRTATDEYRKRASAMLDILRREGLFLAALATPDEPVAVDVERLTRAMDAADPPVDGDGYEEEDHAEHLAYAKEIAAEYARLAGRE